MPDDAPSFLTTAAEITDPLGARARASRAAEYALKRQPAGHRVLFTSEHVSDAEDAGFDRATPVGTDGGFSVAFDGSFRIPSVTLNGSDGEIQITGLEAIKALTDALMVAEALARRMGS